MKVIYCLYIVGSLMLYLDQPHVGALLFGLGSCLGLCRTFNLCGERTPYPHAERSTLTVPTGMGKSLSERIDAGMSGGDDT